MSYLFSVSDARWLAVIGPHNIEYSPRHVFLHGKSSTTSIEVPSGRGGMDAVGFGRLAKCSDALGRS